MLVGGTVALTANDDGNYVIPSSAEGNLSLKAEWKLLTYTVTWKLNGGNINGSTSDVVQTYNHGATLTQPTTPSKDGYKFSSWSGDTSSPVTSNRTITATWTEATFQVKFTNGHEKPILDGGSSSVKQIQTVTTTKAGTYTVKNMIVVGGLDFHYNCVEIYRVSGGWLNIVFDTSGLRGWEVEYTVNGIKQTKTFTYNSSGTPQYFELPSNCDTYTVTALYL